MQPARKIHYPPVHYSMLTQGNSRKRLLFRIFTDSLFKTFFDSTICHKIAGGVQLVCGTYFIFTNSDVVVLRSLLG